VVKFGGGFYCGLLDGFAGHAPRYTFNAFFMSMRAKYVAPETRLHYYSVSFAQTTLSWSDFRKCVRPHGPTSHDSHTPITVHASRRHSRLSAH
jgi:hypothetical protein